ncbi:uncharacterized protein PHALS_03823 [Plasmopara halstedii]|uniref:RxLR-like protein n=1 Tax=Plasmopara halstedii TaxID=4781 RepID=A0A0P1B1M5_PLAHL|nr:uncharacterized protein PHALS_03823 [Plasmopara halstedii]CEG47174.1 hypothetical protein PHALS_03823 [Plasmopara halstedii]|eukprot:XP_024583543.1 hypothetical protein PHALS_03823 [Plasmopara halstedii]
MVTSTCLQFSSLKCLIGVSLCFTLHSAVSHVNDRGQVGPGPQHLPTHNTSALLNDSFPLHDVAQKSELDIDAGVEDARGLLPDSIISTARNRLDTFLDTFRPELSVLRTPLLSNGIEHGHSSVEHDGNALRSDLSSGVKDVIVYERDDGIASAVNKIGRSEKEVDDKAKKRMFDLLEVEVRSKKQDSELLSIIQRGQSSEDESVTSFYDFALLHMLKHKNSAQVVHEKWVKDGVIIKEIRRFLQKHVLDTVPFFKSNMASLLLSHVGYCWKHKSGELTVEELLEYFEQIKLMEDDVVRMAQFLSLSSLLQTNSNTVVPYSSSKLLTP